MWGKQKATENNIQCSLVGSRDVFIEPIARQKIEILMDEYKHQEWLAYLVGKLSDKGNFFVENISVPPHASAYGASAEAEPFNQPKKCIGIIHSHHTMGAFHSGTDHDYVDKNYPVSITVARGQGGHLTYDAVSYCKTPCGKTMLKKADVKYVQFAPLFNKDKWLEEAKSNIDKSKRTYKASEDDEYKSYTNGAPRAVNRKVPYIPVRYRQSILEEPLIINSDGRVLTKKEYDDIIHNSQEGE